MNLTAPLATALFGLATGTVTLVMISDDSLKGKAAVSAKKPLVAEFATTQCPWQPKSQAFGARRTLPHKTESVSDLGDLAAPLAAFLVPTMIGASPLECPHPPVRSAPATDQCYLLWDYLGAFLLAERREPPGFPILIPDGSRRAATK